MQLSIFNRRVMNRLRALGYRCLNHADPATRATVLDLSPHCTDPEIAEFTRSTPDRVRAHRRAMGIDKYVSDTYIRPAA